VAACQEAWAEWAEWIIKKNIRKKPRETGAFWYTDGMLARKRENLWLFLYSFIFLAWAVYRFVVHFPDWIDEMLFKPVIQLVPVLFVVFVFEKKNWASLGFTKHYYVRNILLGVGVGIVLVAERLIIERQRSRELNPTMFASGFPNSYLSSKKKILSRIFFQAAAVDFEE
jgi:hypothetical protein